MSKRLCGGVGGGPHDFSVSPSPLWTNWVFELGWTGLVLGLGQLDFYLGRTTVAYLSIVMMTVDQIDPFREI